MSSRILDYSKWKKIHESKQVNEGLFWDVIEREPIAGTNHKVKVKYIDANSIKVKAVNDRDLVDANGQVAQDLMDNIVIFLNGHDRTNFSREYPALQNMATFYKDNFFTYNVKKENDRRQVVVFSIQKRANFKGVTPETKLISDDAAAGLAQAPEAKNVLANSDKNLLQNTATTDQTANKSTSQVKLTSPIAIADIVNYTADSPFFKMFDNAVAVMATSKIFTDKRATDLINKTADELEAKKIGENSIKLIKGLMAGFGATTFVDKYGRTKEQTQITQSFIDKLASLSPPATTAQNSSRKYYLGLDGRAIFEADDMIKNGANIISNGLNVDGSTGTPGNVASALPADFKMEEFIKAISAGELTTGDIKVPEGGFKKGSVAKKDPEFMKFQTKVIEVFGKSPKMSAQPLYKKFAGYGADGDYGQTTEKMVAALKKLYGLADLDGSTVTKELIDKLYTVKITESAYIGLNYQLVEQLDWSGFEEVSKTYTSKKSNAVKKEAKPDASAIKVDTEVYAAKEMSGFSGSGLVTPKVKFKAGDFLGKVTKIMDNGGTQASQKVAQITNDAADPSVKGFYVLFDNITAKGTKPAEQKTDSSGANQIDLNSIASVTINKPESFVIAMIKTAIDLLGKDWSSKHTDWLISSFTSLNALGGKFASTTKSGDSTVSTVYDPAQFEIFKDIYTPYISPLTGGDAPLKNQIAKTGLKAVGSAKDAKNVNTILTAINTKNNETIISFSDEKALAGAFMLISPTIGRSKLFKMAEELGFDSPGMITAWDELDSKYSTHSLNLARWAVGALGYSCSDFKGYTADDGEIATLKDNIKSSLYAGKK